MLSNSNVAFSIMKIVNWLQVWCAGGLMYTAGVRLSWHQYFVPEQWIRFLQRKVTLGSCSRRFISFYVSACLWLIKQSVCNLSNIFIAEGYSFIYVLALDIYIVQYVVLDVDWFYFLLESTMFVFFSFCLFQSVNMFSIFMSSWKVLAVLISSHTTLCSV